MRPVLREVARRGLVTVVEIDVDSREDLAEAHGVAAVPLLKYVTRRGVAWTHEGLMGRDELVRRVSP